MTYSVAHVLTGHFTIIVARIVTMILAENYEKLSKFVKVTAKILSVLFSGHSVLSRITLIVAAHQSI